MTIHPKYLAMAMVLAIGVPAASQTKSSTSVQKPAASQKKVPAPRRKALDQRRQFVVDVVKSAVSLQQTDSQDRLRVLSAAANIVSPINRAMARDYAREGMRIEQELIQAGQTPVASMFEGGQADCAQVTSFVENIPTARVVAAEQSLIGALSLCPKQALEPVKRKVQAGIDEGHVAPRALLALVESVGPSTPWSQEQFSKMFSSLPADTKANAAEAPNYAAMYDRMAPILDKAVARSSGVQLLLWLGKLEDSGERNLAVNIVTGSMKSALGEEGYQEALASDVMVSQVAQTAGREAEIRHPEEESVSVLQALGNSDVDRTAKLAEMAPSLRAREAAASGFASGTNGNRRMADRYFDIAFSALEKVWSDRSSKLDAPAVVQEVSEAAAQVDPIDALKRAQKLSDKAAQAIGMIAVARVVSGAESPEPMAQQ